MEIVITLFIWILFMVIGAILQKQKKISGNATSGPKEDPDDMSRMLEGIFSGNVQQGSDEALLPVDMDEDPQAENVSEVSTQESILEAFDPGYGSDSGTDQANAAAEPVSSALTPETDNSEEETFKPGLEDLLPRDIRKAVIFQEILNSPKAFE